MMVNRQIFRYLWCFSVHSEHWMRENGQLQARSCAFLLHPVHKEDQTEDHLKSVQMTTSFTKCCCVFAHTVSSTTKAPMLSQLCMMAHQLEDLDNWCSNYIWWPSFYLNSLLVLGDEILAGRPFHSVSFADPAIVSYICRLHKETDMLECSYL